MEKEIQDVGRREELLLQHLHYSVSIFEPEQFTGICASGEQTGEQHGSVEEHNFHCFHPRPLSIFWFVCTVSGARLVCIMALMNSLSVDDEYRGSDTY